MIDELYVLECLDLSILWVVVEGFEQMFAPRYLESHKLECHC